MFIKIFNKIYINKSTIVCHKKSQTNQSQAKSSDNIDSFSGISDNQLNLNITPNINEKLLPDYEISEIKNKRKSVCVTDKPWIYKLLNRREFLSDSYSQPTVPPKKQELRLQQTYLDIAVNNKKRKKTKLSISHYVTKQSLDCLTIKDSLSEVYCSEQIDISLTTD